MGMNVGLPCVQVRLQCPKRYGDPAAATVLGLSLHSAVIDTVKRSTSGANLCLWGCEVCLFRWAGIGGAVHLTQSMLMVYSWPPGLIFPKEMNCHSQQYVKYKLQISAVFFFQNLCHCHTSSPLKEHTYYVALLSISFICRESSARWDSKVWFVSLSTSAFYSWCTDGAALSLSKPPPYKPLHPFLHFCSLQVLLSLASLCCPRLCL